LAVSVLSLAGAGLFFFGATDPPSSPPRGSQVTLSLTAEPPTLDWNLATDNVSFDVITNLMEGLAQYDDDLNPVPALAESWDVLDGGRKFVFHLREDALWSDGRPVTADDFVYSWRRLLDPEVAAEYAYFLYDVKNAYEFNTGKIEDPDQIGVRAEDDRTLAVELNKPAVYFPGVVTFMVTYPVRRDVVERHGDLWTEPEHIVTAGPYRLTEWRHEYRLTLTRNENYYGPAPAVGTIRYFVVGEINTALTLYETGVLDVAEIPPLAIPRYRDHPEYRNAPMLRGYYYGFNVEKPPFDRVEVRRAIAHAIDKREIANLLRGGEIPTDSWVPKGMFGYNPDIGLRYDPALAREYLKKAGFPDGEGFPEFAIGFNSDQTHEMIAENVQEQLRRNLNVFCRLENQEWKVYLKTLRVDPPEVFRLGWGADYPDPDNFMNLFTSASGNNNTRWRNPEYDRIITEAASETDPAVRKTHYDRAQRILTEEDVPMVPLFIQTQNLLVKPHLKNVHVNPMDVLYVRKIRIEGGG
jgi:oligopeptide transport system substrate-binding protein